MVEEEREGADEDRLLLMMRMRIEVSWVGLDIDK